MFHVDEKIYKKDLRFLILSDIGMDYVRDLSLVYMLFRIFEFYTVVGFFMIIPQLREKTAFYHQQVEENSLLSRLLGDLTLQDYIEILKKFYGFYFPLEKQYIPESLKKNAELKDYFYPKLKLLERDLKVFLPTVSNLPVCPACPNPESPFGWLGVFYTLEGSCHGRAMLWPRIHRKLGIEKGHTFFSGASDDLKVRWGKFCQKMTDLVTSEAEKEAVIQGSVETFISLNKWFDLK